MPAARPTPPTRLRGWQVGALGALEGWAGGPFLISAAPGAGKTRPALELARRLLAAGAIDRVAVVCPTGPLTRQWATAAAALGVHLAPDAPSPVPPKDFHGVAVTYSRIASSGAAWNPKVSPRTLVIADEAHHLGEDLAWGDGFAAAFARTKWRLMLSGTPFRSDASVIPGLRYDRDGVVVSDVSYSYGDAVRDGVCRPVAFITYDGTLSWRSGEDVIESTFETVLSAREASRRYRTAISTDLPDGLQRILGEAHERLQKLRAGGHRDAGGLVVAADGTHARRVAALLKAVTGKSPTVVLHTEAKAAEKLARFTASRDEWLVAVNMVSEGVDIPRLRVGVYATAAKTPLIFRQIVGRFVRTISGRAPEPSWVYLPADPVLRSHAEAVETELRHVLRRSDDEGVFDEVPERSETERGEAEDFVPLMADVAPQMTLFGAPAPQPAAMLTALAPLPAGSVEMPAYQRRNLLRDKRHRLVGDLCRRDRRPQAEINAWVNREAGITRVQDASIEQLERSIELLLDELTARR